jgi:hypothetical protein
MTVAGIVCSEFLLPSRGNSRAILVYPPETMAASIRPFGRGLG